MKKEQIINNYIKERNVKSYLEIGYDKGYNFNAIKCNRKVCVDIKLPHDEIKSKNIEVVEMPSSQFFKENKEKFDVVFIDGDHRYAGCAEDIINASKISKFVIMHDVNPREEKYALDERKFAEWYGLCYRVFYDLIAMGLKVDYHPEDCGLGIIEFNEPINEIIPNNISFEEYKKTIAEKFGSVK